MGLAPHLSTEFKNLTNLLFLDLTGNKISEFPTEITALKKLKALGLEDNHLYKLSSEIGNLKNLIILGLEDNELSQLPSEIVKLRKHNQYPTILTSRLVDNAYLLTTMTNHALTATHLQNKLKYSYEEPA